MPGDKESKEVLHMKKNLRTLMALVLCLAMAMTMATAALAQTADGVYEGAGQGLNGPI